MPARPVRAARSSRGSRGRGGQAMEESGSIRAQAPVTHINIDDGCYLFLPLGALEIMPLTGGFTSA